MSVVGGRRTFPVHFKLQVLDSYRQDPDCRGNQRATARKYGIHRRQIQKWLQVENILRASMRTEIDKDGALNLSCKRHPEVCRNAISDELDVNRVTCTNVINKSYVSEQRNKDVAVINIKQEISDESSSSSAPVYHDLQTITDLANINSSLKIVENSGLSKRRSFSLQFKLEVLNAFYNDTSCRGNQRATARKFGINRRQVQKWLHQELELRREAELTGGLDRQRLGRWLESEDSGKCEEGISDNKVHNDGQYLVQTNNKELCSDHVDTTYNNEENTDRKRKSQTFNIPPVKKRKEASVLGENNMPCEVENNYNYVQDVNMEPVQEVALCLVKVKQSPENTNNNDLEDRKHTDSRMKATSVDRCKYDGEINVPNASALGSKDLFFMYNSTLGSKRHSYPLEFKLKALDAYHGDKECMGNQRAVAKKFKVHRRQIQKWLKQEPQLRHRVIIQTDYAVVPFLICTDRMCPKNLEEC